MTAEIPRLVITAGKSGAGKTMVTCGLLAALKRRGLNVTAYKCGPDYIDPAFHREVLGIPSYNLDTFLCGRENVRGLLLRGGMPDAGISYTPEDQPCAVREAASRPCGAQPGAGTVAVIEGVMGYYDGLGGVSLEASTFDVADAVKSPAVLVVDGKGMSVSAVPYIQGLLKYQEKIARNSYIKGVILNRISPAMYGRMKELIGREAKVRVYGYVPEMKDFTLESRYLGLKMPGETAALKEKLERLGTVLEETLDIGGLMELAALAEPLTVGGDGLYGRIRPTFWENGEAPGGGKLRIGVAADEAFCFSYQDNLDILAEMGAQIVPFSPLKDGGLPTGLDGMIFYGGYPELYAGRLAGNHKMRDEIRRAAAAGLPCIAECGGFMYLQERIKDAQGRSYPMCGVLPGESFYTASLRRFGYVTLQGGRVFGKDAGKITAHEFHYYDSEQCGEAFAAKKPLSDRAWRCMVSTDAMLAGYPHIHYAGNMEVAEAFIGACRRYRGRGIEEDSGDHDREREKTDGKKGA